MCVTLRKSDIAERYSLSSAPLSCVSSSLFIRLLQIQSCTYKQQLHGMTTTDAITVTAVNIMCIDLGDCVDSSLSFSEHINK